MTKRPGTLFLSLLLAPAALAQQPGLDVSDLVRRSGLDPVAAGMVRRGLPLFEGNWAEADGRRFLLGEERLVTIAGADPVPSALPLLERDALLALLAEVRGGGTGSGAFVEVGPRVLLDTGFAEQVAVDLAAIRAAMPPRIEVDVRLERVAPDGTTVDLLAGTEAFQAGEVRILSDARTHRLLAGLEVEIAQSSAIATPTFDTVELGASVSLRARLLPDGRAAVIESVLRVCDAGEPGSIDVGEGFGPLDRLGTRVDELGSTFVVERGATAEQVFGTTDGGVLRLRCTARYEPPKAAVRSDLRVVATPLFGRPVVGFRFVPRHGDGLEDAGEQSLLGVQELAIGAIGEQTDAFALFLPPGSGATGVLVLNGDRGERVGRVVEQRVSSVLQAQRLSVEVFSVPSGAVVEARGMAGMPDGAEPLASFDGHVVNGLPVAFGSGVERSFVRDWQTEVAQASRIPRPAVGLMDEGAFVTAWVQPGSGSRVGLELDLDRLLELRKQPIGLGREMAVILDTSNPLVLPAERVQAELPRTGSARVRTVVDLGEEGTAVLRRSARAVLGSDRELVVRVAIG